MSSDELIDIEIAEEHKETLDTLQAMSSELQVKAIRTALKFAGKPLVESLKGVIGQRSGRLASMVNQTIAKVGDPVYASSTRGWGYKAGSVRLSPGEVGIIVGPNRMRAYYGYLGMILETGADPHIIGTQRGSLRIGGNFVGKEVEHPGFKGRPIFAPAFNKAADQVETGFYEGLKRHLDRIS